VSAPGTDSHLPHWPALMDEARAAAYCGEISVPTFRALTARYKVPAVDMGARLLRWRKADLDRLVDSLPARGVPSAPEAANAPDSFDDAMRRAARRGRR
jgi:hypothetical protein